MRGLSRRLRIAAGALAVTILLVLSIGSHASALAATQGECRVQSLPSFDAQGLGANAGAVADIVEVACYHEPEQPVTIEDPEIYAQCGNSLHWARPNPYAAASGASFEVTLDGFGNAVLALWSHGCRAGESAISAKLDVAPKTTSTTTFTVQPSVEGPAGFETLPASQHESGDGVATIIQAEVDRDPEARMEMIASNLYRRCHLKPHLHWVYEGKERAGGKSAKVTLNNDGQAFAVVLGAECQIGESLVTGEEVDSPYRSFTTSFEVLPDEELL